ncbi:hypothetical protein ABEB36_012258 [Hypothenemus hampei]|uniref:Uncharacterized protein n=1 Tax=Hypothenemus hampei TaxID=57062 RepID=A0ABD1EAT1_HYPHA
MLSELNLIETIETGIDKTTAGTTFNQEGVKALVKSVETLQKFKTEDYGKSFDRTKESLTVESPENMEEIMARYVRTPNDTNDPSYSHLTLPYRVICRERYRKAGQQMKAQFIKELNAHQLLRDRALDGVRIHREFANAYINKMKHSEMIILTREQKEKIEKLLNSS